jgi:hypothetical protein
MPPLIVYKRSEELIEPKNRCGILNSAIINSMKQNQEYSEDTLTTEWGKLKTFSFIITESISRKDI